MQKPSQRLLAWYDRHARTLPWRVPPGSGGVADPYRVWLSEIMLQQTTVAAVIPYFETFTARWPRVEDLAGAPLDDVLAAWAGLGYYARARNLHACAATLAQDHGGVFPGTEDDLRALPGIGAYTAAAIAAIAFGRPAVVVDGNVERVMARFHGLETPLPEAKPALKSLAAALTPTDRAGDYAQAVMDLGATVCTPRSPRCDVCPLADDCIARASGRAAELPRKSPKAQKPTRIGAAFWLTRPDGAVLIRRRGAKGLLAKMPEVPSAGFTTAKDPAPDPARDAPVPADWRAVPGTVRHTFTHFHLELTIWTAHICDKDAAGLEGEWHTPARLAEVGLPTVMRKVAERMATGDGPLFSVGSS